MALDAIFLFTTSSRLDHKAIHLPLISKNQLGEEITKGVSIFKIQNFYYSYQFVEMAYRNIQDCKHKKKGFPKVISQFSRNCKKKNV